MGYSELVHKTGTNVLVTITFFRMLIEWLENYENIDMSTVVITFDVLKQNVHRQCLEVFKNANTNSVVCNLASSAETAPIEQVFRIIKYKLKKRS